MYRKGATITMSIEEFRMKFFNRQKLDSIESIAAQLGVSKSTVQRYLKKNNIKRKVMSPHLESIDSFLNFYKSHPKHISITDLAKELNTNRDALRKWLYQNNTSIIKIKFAVYGIDNTPLTKNEFIEFYKTQPKDITVKELAAKLNKSTHTLYEWLYRNDLKMSQLRNEFHGVSCLYKVTPDEFIDWYKTQPKNATVKELADSLNLPHSTLSEWLNKHNMSISKLKSSNIKLAPELRSKETFLEFYNTQPKDVTVKELADMISVSRNQLAGWMHRHNIKITELRSK